MIKRHWFRRDDPPTVEAREFALAGWAQMDTEGRALFAREHGAGQWRRWAKSSAGGAAVGLDEDGAAALVWLFRYQQAVMGDVPPRYRRLARTQGEENEVSSKPYYYNADIDEYVFPVVKFKAGQFIVSGPTIRRLVESYSNDGGKETINQIAEREGWSRRMVVEIKGLLGITHDSLPFTDEEIAETPDDELAENLLATRKLGIRNKARQAIWRQTTKAAESWQRLEMAVEELADQVAGVAPEPIVGQCDIPDALQPYTLVWSVSDLHVAKLGYDWGANAYDKDTARERVMWAFGELVERVKMRGRPSRIVLIDQGDTEQSDNMAKTTTKGTPQDMDGTIYGMHLFAVTLFADLIRGLAEIAPVDVRVVPGNHDKVMSLARLVSYSGIFANDDRVNVVLRDAATDAGLTRQYVRIGKALLMFVHGDIGGPRRWVSVMGRERARDWAETCYRYVFAGHWHKESAISPFDFQGVIVERVPSLTGSDEYHHEQGYAEDPKTKLWIVTDEGGIIATELIRVPPAMLRKRWMGSPV